MAIAVSSATPWGETISEQNGATKEGSDDSSRNAVPRTVRQVYELDPLSDSRWPALVATHPQASVFHTQAWLSALQVDIWIPAARSDDLRARGPADRRHRILRGRLLADRAALGFVAVLRSLRAVAE
jgi:hypothetical protein